MVGQTYAYGTQTNMHHRKVLKAITKDNVRYYIIRNLDNPESKEIEAVADTIDKKFGAQRGEIRKDKYSDRAFQKRRKKAGGF